MTKLNENEIIDEGVKELVASFALSLAFMFPGVAPAETVRFLKDENKNEIRTIYDKENIFKQMLKDQSPNEQFGNYKFWQSCNILSLTLFGEGRSEISNGGFDLISDSILNRTASGTPDLKRVADICVGKKKGYKFQYSFWNNNKNALKTIIDKNDAVVPTSITNVVEKRAWETCITRSIEILTNNYTVKDKNVNSYYVTKMKDPPSWKKQLKNKKVVGVHTFGYVLSNDPKYTDMATMEPIKKIETEKPKSKNKSAAKRKTNTKSATYTVKNDDTLWSISQKLKTTVSDLKKKNRLKSNTILPGQKLKF